MAWQEAAGRDLGVDELPYDAQVIRTNGRHEHRPPSSILKFGRSAELPEEQGRDVVLEACDAADESGGATDFDLVPSHREGDEACGRAVIRVRTALMSVTMA